jgi:GMP synthase (glutamine-hydrolysing)
MQNVSLQSAVCENQAFIYDSSVIAPQFHPEATGNEFETWLVAHTVELTAASIDIRALREEWKAQKQNLQTRAERCLGRWLDSQGF